MIPIPTTPTGVDAQTWRLAINRCLAELEEGYRPLSLIPFNLPDDIEKAVCAALKPLMYRNTGVNWGQNGHLQPQKVNKEPQTSKMAPVEAKMHKTVVVNAHFEAFDVFIGRKSSYKRVSRHEAPCATQHDIAIQVYGADGFFGNPHILDRACPICSGKHHGQVVHQREDSILAFKRDFWARVQADPGFVQDLKQLEGKRLGCFCKQSQREVACHGDVITAWLAAGCPTEPK